MNAPTKLMKAEGYGAGYEYDHDAEGAHAGLDYFPEGMDRVRFYEPSERGREKATAERVAAQDAKRRERSES